MSNPIQNRYDFVLFFDVKDGVIFHDHSPT